MNDLGSMNKMPQIGILTALILIALGVGAFIYTGWEKYTALIPAYLATPLLITSILSLQAKFLKLGMHLAATIGLLGFVAPTGMVLGKLASGKFEWRLSSVSMIAMATICLFFVLLCVKSFIDVRKARQKS